jgi:hypothetical protein
MRRVFGRRTSTSPGQYKAHFGLKGALADGAAEYDQQPGINPEELVSGTSVW